MVAIYRAVAQVHFDTAEDAQLAAQRQFQFLNQGWFLNHVWLLNQSFLLPNFPPTHCQGSLVILVAVFVSGLQGSSFIVAKRFRDPCKKHDAAI